LSNWVSFWFCFLTSASEALRSAGLPSHSSVISQHSKGSKSPEVLMHLGPPETAEILKTLPQKYRRKPVSQEEMGFIQCGGSYQSLQLLFVIRQTIFIIKDFQNYK
jgi:small subunit ribosomal protein S36